MDFNAMIRIHLRRCLAAEHFPVTEDAEGPPETASVRISAEKQGNKRDRNSVQLLGHLSIC